MFVSRELNAPDQVQSGSRNDASAPKGGCGPRDGARVPAMHGPIAPHDSHQQRREYDHEHDEQPKTACQERPAVPHHRIEIEPRELANVRERLLACL